MVAIEGDAIDLAGPIGIYQVGLYQVLSTKALGVAARFMVEDSRPLMRP